MDNERYTTFGYAKIFLLMIIPVYGFFFTVLLGFSKDITGELRFLARGALVARIVFLFVAIICIGIFFSAILPMLNNFINNTNFIRLFQ